MVENAAFMKPLSIYLQNAPRKTVVMIHIVLLYINQI